jgi:hypothetical protein
MIGGADGVQLTCGTSGDTHMLGAFTVPQRFGLVFTGGVEEDCPHAMPAQRINPTAAMAALLSSDLIFELLPRASVNY